MKKLFFFAALFCAASLTTVNAQSCTKKATAGASCCAATKAAMAKAVSADASIEKKICSTTGTETFYRNAKCETTGKMVSTQVEFDSKTNTFVNVSPSRAAMPAAEGTAPKACAKGTSAKSCAKSCTKGAKQASVNAKADAPAKAQLTKMEN